MTYRHHLSKFWLGFLLLLCQGGATSFATSIDGNPSSPTTDLMVMEMTLRGPGDITNHEGNDLSSYCGTTQADSWIGTGRDLSQSYLALRFHGTPLPPRSRLQLVSANLQLTNNRNTQWTTTAFEVRAELSPTPAVLDCTPANAPASRLTTAEFASYQGTDKWFNHAPWSLAVTAPVAAWAAQGYQTDTLMLVVKGTGTKEGRKFFYNYNRKKLDPQTLPKLTLTYRLLPIPSNHEALQNFLESLEGFEDYQLGADGQLVVTLNGQIHRGQLESQLTAGVPPADGLLHLNSIDDRNGDGIADYELLYPSGDRQLAYYFGIDPPPQTLPPDPATVAPPLDPTVASLFDTQVSFLYQGENPIQTGVAAGTFDPRRIAVVRGPVTSRDGSPLSGVTLTILHHPEWGQTLSRANGWFDLAVNGGGNVTVQYQKDGYLPVQRTLFMPWNEFNVLDRVVMTPLDANMSPIDLSADLPLQVASGSVVTDEDGTRRAVLLFPQGLQATMTLPDGSIQPLIQLDVRATEYTVGATGPQAMPADLPPQVGYTYAVEYSVDQALAAGATRVDFSQPVIAYVENFLQFPVGTPVPAGWYDFERAVWKAQADGRVIQLRALEQGLAQLEVTGQGQVATPAELAALGITPAEQQQLAQLYSVGQSLWRVPLTHFSPCDYNWILIDPPGSQPPTLKVSNTAQPPLESPCYQAGSVIECETQVLGETLPVTGTPLTLNYRSDRVVGRKVARTLTIPLRGNEEVSDYLGLHLEVQVAGRRFTQVFPPNTPVQEIQWNEWEGRDVYGRWLVGAQPVRVRLGYQYQTRPGAATTADLLGGQSFAKVPSSGSVLWLARSGRQVQPAPRVLWGPWQTLSLGNGWEARGSGLGGWSLSSQHAYAAPSRDLVLGDGRWQSQASYLGGVISTRYQSTSPRSPLAVDAAGYVYVVTGNGYQISRLTPQGVLELVAGDGRNGATIPVVDHSPATTASLARVLDLQVGADHSLYVLEQMAICCPNGEYTYSNRIRQLTNGILSLVAGGGQSPHSAVLAATYAGTLAATQLELSGVNAMAVTPHGIYFTISVATQNTYLFQIDSNGLVLPRQRLGGRNAFLAATATGTVYLIQARDGSESSTYWLIEIGPTVRLNPLNPRR